MGFDAVGNRVLQLDQLENPTYMAYDGLRRLTHVTDAAGAVTYFGHDARSKLALKVQAAGGEATYMAYDGAGRLVKQWFTADAPAYFTYDESGQLTQEETL